MNRTALLVCCTAMVLCMAGCSKPQRVSGTYQGICRNLTYGGEANLVLTAIVDRGGVVSGDISITGELQGSSSIKGLVEGKNITFTSSQRGSGFAITWRGRVRRDEISGEYLVSANDIQKILGTSDQIGEWTVTRMR